MENDLTQAEQQTEEMFEDIEYNNKMIEYRFKFDNIKKRIDACSLSNIFIMGCMLLMEIFSLWNPNNKEMGIGLAFAIFIITVFISSAIIIKRVPELFLILAAVFIISEIIEFNLIQLILAVMNIAFYLISREIKEIKKLPGYPEFATRKIRHKT